MAIHQDNLHPEPPEHLGTISEIDFSCLPTGAPAQRMRCEEPACLQPDGTPSYRRHAWDEVRDLREDTFNVTTPEGLANYVDKVYACNLCGLRKNVQTVEVTNYGPVETSEEESA